jgi:hypothetical protein
MLAGEIVKPVVAARAEAATTIAAAMMNSAIAARGLECDANPDPPTNPL